MNILFVGDIVGSTGRKALRECLPYLKREYAPDFIVVNGENAAGGRGITASIAAEFFELGVHGITMGNHTWDNKDIFSWIDEESRVIRPMNYPEGTPGRGYSVLHNGSKSLIIANVQGRTFLPPLECPFRMLDDWLKQLKGKDKHILVDIHAEATSEKISLGWHLDGKVSAVIGTHTHVQTHDERILPKGTAYVTDVGMTGSRDGVLGMEREAVLRKFLTQLPVRFQADEGRWQLNAVSLQLDDTTGLARKVQLIRMFEDEVRFE